MMQTKAMALRHKRAVLVAQIGMERAALAQQGAALRPAALMIDKVSAGIRYLKSHPGLLLLPVAILALWRPRRLLAFAVSSLGMWRLVQRGWRRLRLSSGRNER
ncbi:MAG: hypothetical protein IV108_06460 [Burkholderiales bacterium]|nr:hypothetical protein [Burkholderiales bacterium]